MGCGAARSAGGTRRAVLTMARVRPATAGSRLYPSSIRKSGGTSIDRSHAPHFVARTRLHKMPPDRVAMRFR